MELPDCHPIISLLLMVALKSSLMCSSLHSTPSSVVSFIREAPSVCQRNTVKPFQWLILRPTAKTHVSITALKSFSFWFGISFSREAPSACQRNTARAIIKLFQWLILRPTSNSYVRVPHFHQCNQVLRYLHRHFFFSRTFFSLPKKYNSCSKSISVVDLASPSSVSWVWAAGQATPQLDAVQIDRMAPPRPATIHLKRKRVIDPADLQGLFDNEPVDFRSAWNHLKAWISELTEYARPTVPSVSSSQWVYC